MKICEERETEKVTLKYKDLKEGDVFRWRSISVHAAIKTYDGHTTLASGCDDVGCHYPKHPSNSCIIRYPNACITLGDPE